MKHPVKHLRFPKAAVETVAKFRQIAGQMFGTDAMVDTPDIAFDIGDQGVDPGQDLRCLLPRAGYQPLMTETGRSVQEALALPAICFDHCLGRQPLPYQRLNLFAADSGHQPHGGKPGLIGRGFHGYHHLGLASGATSTFAGLGSTEVGVVHFDQAGQLVVRIPCGQGLANLVAHGPDGFVALDLQHPLQSQHGDAAFLASPQPDHPEPFGQRSSGFVEHGTCGQRGLIAASLTMV